jgi:hypothetical protein
MQPDPLTQVRHGAQTTGALMQEPLVHDEVVQASGSLPLPHDVPSGSAVPMHVEPLHMSLVVQSLPSSQLPPPSGLQVDGSPLQDQHCSI